MTAHNNYITTNEAADVLHVSRQRVLQLIQEKRLDAEKFGNVYMIERGALERIEAKPKGRPRKADAAEKSLRGQTSASNGSSGKARKRGGKR